MNKSRIILRIGLFIFALGIMAFILRTMCTKEPSMSTNAGKDKTESPLSKKNVLMTNHVAKLEGETSNRMIRPRKVWRSSSKGGRMSDSLLRRFLERAIDNDDEKKVLKLASMAAQSDDGELRRKALQALGWYGANAIPEMLQFLEDPDDEIVRQAFSQIDDSLDMIENEVSLARLVKLTMSYATEENQAISLLSKLEGIDEDQAEFILTEMLHEPDAAAGTVLGELLRDEYKFITENDYRE